MKIRRNLKLLLSVSLMTLTVAVDNNVVYSTTKNLNNNVIYIGSGNLDLVSKAFDSNIKTVANVTENNEKKYQQYLINEKYWATSGKYKDSIENLKKLFTYVWENGNRDDYYKNLVGAFVEEISTLLKNDKKLSQYDTEPWTKTKTGKYTLELLMGLVSFRTFYKVKVNADVKPVDALFNEVFNEINKDSYYQSLIEHFKGNGEDVKKILNTVGIAILTNFTS